MKKQTFIDRAQRLCIWATGTRKVFFINGCLGHSIKLHGEILHMYDAEGAYKGDFFRFTATNVDHFDFDEEAYQFRITKGGDGYDIEAYEIIRINFPTGA